MKNTTTKWTMLAVPAFLALAACTAAPGDETEMPKKEEVKAKPVEAPVGTQMKPTCMVNDDATEAICCNPIDCWYVDLRDPYSYR